MNVRKKLNYRETGITLVALVVTIIVILILAGITLSFLFGEYGILGRAQMAYQVNDEGTIKEEIQVAYGSAQVDAITKGLSIEEVLQAELRKQDGSATAVLNGNVINISYKGYQTTIDITTGSISELIKIATTNPENDENDPYRGLLTAQDKIDQDLFYYKIITNPTTGANNETKLASSNPVKLADTSTTGTAMILGINLEYVFSKEFNDSNTENWPEIEQSTETGANSAYINAMKPYVERLIIPNEVTLNSNGEVDSNGQKYKITEINDLLYPPGSNYISNMDSSLTTYGHWGTGEVSKYQESYILWESPDLNVNIIIPEGITKITNIADLDMIYWNGRDNYGRQSIKNVSFPNTIEWLYYGSFSQCKGLTEITLPPTIRIIDSQSFLDCDNLKKITAPLGVANPGDNIGVWPQALEEFVGNGGGYIGQNWISEFYGVTNLKKLTIPETVTKIGYNAFEFEGIASKNVNLPSWITYIEEGAFGEKTDSVYINSNQVEIEEYAFDDGTDIYINTAELARQFLSGNEKGLMNTNVHIKSGLINNPNEIVAYPYSEGEPDYGAFIQGNTADGYIEYEYQYDYFTGDNNGGNPEASASASASD